MPDNDRPGRPAGRDIDGGLQVRPRTALSTLVLPPVVAAAEDDEAIHFRDLWRVVVKRKWVRDLGVPHRAGHRAGGDDDGDADLPRDHHAQDRARGVEGHRLQGRPRRSRGTRGHRLLPHPVRAAEEPHAGRARGRAAEPAAAVRGEGRAGRSRGGPDSSGAGRARATRRPPRRRRRMCRAASTPRRSAPFLGSLTVEPIRNSRLVRVLFDSPDPRLAVRRAERAGAELHRRQPRAALRGVVVRQDLPRGKARADQGEARGLRARAGRVPARAADHQRRREAEHPRADAGVLQRGRGEGRRGSPQGRGAVPRVPGEPRVLAA